MAYGNAQPAAKWMEALPVGNGPIRAMVLETLKKKGYQLNEDSMWAPRSRIEG